MAGLINFDEDLQQYFQLVKQVRDQVDVNVFLKDRIVNILSENSTIRSGEEHRWWDSEGTELGTRYRKLDEQDYGNRKIVLNGKEIDFGIKSRSIEYKNPDYALAMKAHLYTPRNILVVPIVVLLHHEIFDKEKHHAYLVEHFNFCDKPKDAKKLCEELDIFANSKDVNLLKYFAYDWIERNGLVLPAVFDTDPTAVGIIEARLRDKFNQKSQAIMERLSSSDYSVRL